MTSDKPRFEFTGEDYFPPDLEPGELQLLVAFDIWIHREHANPERKGCPGRDRLEAVVRARTKVEDEYTLKHVSLCAACLDEMRDMNREFANNREQLR
jgi:hypothetical protein